MSRRSAAAAVALVLLVPPTARAQDSVTADQALTTAEQAYGPPPPEKKCPSVQQSDEIVVCAEQQEQSQFRVRSDRQAEDDYARATMDRGAPRAPDVAGPGIFRGPPTVGGLCGIGLNGCPPPPAYMVDFSQLPEAPPGSDADRIGRGLAPRGDDVGTGSPASPDKSGPVTPPESASPEAQP